MTETAPPPAPAETAAAPRVAVVVPIFRHSVLVGEAVESVLAQTAGFGIRIVLVNDGCPHRETDDVCRDYALAHPDRVTYLRKPNGGLSDARNFGIRHVLDRLPSVEAIYMLDADNRLRPPALERAMAVLDADPDAAWIYPNIDMFGNGQQVDFSGPYSLLVHTALNVCEAGSLIRREVFEAGILFDTGFRLGFEDWDFFLSAAQAGFRGRNLPEFGFLYRKRPESMLAESEREASEIRSSLRKKHRSLFTPRRRLELEQEETPRYAILLSDRSEVLLTVDPDSAPRRMSLEEYTALYRLARNNPSRAHVPPYLVVTTSGMLEVVRRAQCLHWLFWHLEQLSETRGLAAVTVRHDPEGRYRAVQRPVEAGAQAAAGLLMLEGRILDEILEDESMDWINTIISETCAPPVALVELALPAHVDLSGLSDTAAFDFLIALRRMRAETDPAAAQPREWRKPGIPWREKAHKIVRDSFDGAPVYPRLADGARHVGFVLPLVEFGGVEKVALNMAAGLKAHGWVPHLFVVGQDDGAISREWTEVFASVNFLSDADFSAWGGDGRGSYVGTTIPDWAAKGRHNRALGLMYWLDAVVNAHGGAFAGVMGQLRGLGITTVNSLHLNDLSASGRPVGNTYLGLAYEHAFTVVAPCSYQLADWCHALGVPEDKIVPVPNAPSFAVPRARLERDQEARLARGPETPLRVMYLGRLDRQKGIHRLEETMRQTQTEGLEVEWRIIGKAVVPEEGGAVPSATLARALEPPLETVGGLTDAFAWADAILLPSSYEGLPLTILEAMRSGVVPIATDVGAVSEVVRPGRNGVLLPLETAVPAAMAALRELSGDRGRLAELSRQAYADLRDRDWTAATEALNARLTTTRMAAKSQTS